MPQLRRGRLHFPCTTRVSGGGYDRNIVSYDTLYKTIEYAHHNPVKRGLVTRDVDWKWSSAAWYEGVSHGPLHLDAIE